MNMNHANFSLKRMSFDFTLPKTPALKTSFGFHPATAFAGAQAAGGTASQTTLVKRYTENALAHRVTLRGLIDLPKAQAHYENTLEDYLPNWTLCLKTGQPPSLFLHPYWKPGFAGACRRFCQRAQTHR